MLSNDNTKKLVECTFSTWSGVDWCPHAVQVALTTDPVGTSGKDGGAITLQNVIAAREVAATAAEDLSIKCGSRGTPPCMRLTLRNIDGYRSNCTQNKV